MTEQHLDARFLRIADDVSEDELRILPLEQVAKLYLVPSAPISRPSAPKKKSPCAYGKLSALDEWKDLQQACRVMLAKVKS